MSDGIEVFFQDIRSAFRTALMGIAGLPSEIEWEGRPFTPPATGPFMRENLVPVGTLTRGGGPNGLLQHRVMLAVNLFYPSGSGTLDAEAAAGKLLRAFRPGTSIQHGSASATVQEVARQRLLQETDYLNCPVTITAIGYTVT